jgi:hypothetical protein
VLGIQGHADESFILGAAFMRNYFTVFDMEYNLIGLSPHSSSLASLNIFDRVAPNLPLTDLSRSTDENLFAFGVVSNILMPITILLIVCLIYYLVTGKKLFEDSNK